MQHNNRPNLPKPVKTYVGWVSEGAMTPLQPLAKTGLVATIMACPALGRSHLKTSIVNSLTSWILVIKYLIKYKFWICEYTAKIFIYYYEYFMFVGLVWSILGLGSDKKTMSVEP